MELFQSRSLIRSAALILSIPFFTSCASNFNGVSTKDVSNALHLSGDGRTAWFASAAFPEDLESRLSGGNITFVHEATGIQITCPLLSDKNRYYFSNYGRLLRKGDNVAILFDGRSPTRATLE